MSLLKYIVLSFLVASGSLAAQEHAVSLVDPKFNRFLSMRDFCMSENGQEAFFTLQSPDGKISQIVSIMREKAGCSEPELMFLL